ncbi:hypothetical protein VPNG_09234 [Cytospora leucostoma]|uniref:Heme oxygenase-like protein n=1 Tax=Cytospora leucostoma TaxID=1230097 RepID=A0A423W0Y1_9PEZI|nr:hypothetical protein VPNG_09234 [Cytospora leucostoma]
MADVKDASPNGDTQSLAQSINAAILSSHTKINSLILDRMPRAVPPQTDNPSTYITGLLHFGAIYIAFESLWQSILGIHTEIAPIPYTYPFSSSSSHRDEVPQITERTRHILETMYWPNMLRFSRLKKDIRTITGWPQHVVDEQIRLVGTSGRLAKFLAHVQEVVNLKPHVLLAYAYGLYLALLSGGTYIRTELMYLKADFWHALPTPIKPNMVLCNREHGSPQMPNHHETPDDNLSQHKVDSSFKAPLEFLDFDTPLGDNSRQQTKDLKAEFKRRFTDAEEALTEPERKDIIKESVAIFQHLDGVVGQLDKICGTPQAKDHVAMALNPSSQSHSRTATFGFRFRDSIAVAKERLLRTRRKPSGGNPVTATIPTLPTNAVTMSADFDSSKSSSPPSSPSTKDYEDAQFKHLSSSGSELAQNAVLPGEGFRTIHYDSDLPVPDRSPSGDDDLEKLHGGLDGTKDVNWRYSACCPIARVSGAKASATTVKQEDPGYALFTIIINFIVLVGFALLFMAYLYARHGDVTTRLLDLHLTNDW